MHSVVETSAEIRITIIRGADLNTRQILLERCWLGALDSSSCAPRALLPPPFGGGLFPLRACPYGMARGVWSFTVIDTAPDPLQAGQVTVLVEPSLHRIVAV